jgi:hypothetical protein
MYLPNAALCSLNATKTSQLRDYLRLPASNLFLRQRSLTRLEDYAR